MPTYTYRARDEYGKLVAGTMNAVSADELTVKLRKMGYMATSVHAVRAGIKIHEITQSLNAIRQQDLTVFYFQLANLIEAGIPILPSLTLIEAQVENKKLSTIISDTRRSIEAGDSFSVSLERHERVFGKLMVSMVKAGEQSGKLDKVLRRYAAYAEAQEELREKIKGALFYPAFLFIASVLVIVFIVTFLIPQFVDLFTKAGIRLPMTTRLLYALGLMIKGYWFALIISVMAVFFAVKKYLAAAMGKLQYDRLVLKLPLMGLLMRKVYVSRFSRTLATLLSSGVPILQSLAIAKEVIGNEVIAKVIANAYQSVEQGQKISEPLKISKEFPLDAVQMIAVGEETGDLDGMLNKVADFYDLSIGYAIKKLTVMIEPLFLIIMGGIVAFIMASMVLPVFDMVKILRH